MFAKKNIKFINYLYENFTITINNRIRNKLIIYYFKNNSVEPFKKFLHLYKYNLFTIKFNSSLLLKKIDFFWESCFTNKFTISKLVYKNYLENDNHTDIFNNINHQNYFFNLLYYSKQNNNLYNEIIQWIFQISNFQKE